MGSSSLGERGLISVLAGLKTPKPESISGYVTVGNNNNNNNNNNK